MANARHPPAQRRSTANLIIKEGFLFKKGGLIKSWSRRYFVLNRESLCYFKRELQAAQRREDGVQGLEPLGRIFLTDIVSIDTEGVEKKKAFVFALHTPKRAVLLQAANAEDKLNWAEAIRKAKEEDKEAERKDPFRRTLRRLAPGTRGRSRSPVGRRWGTEWSGGGVRMDYIHFTSSTSLIVLCPTGMAQRQRVFRHHF